MSLFPTASHSALSEPFPVPSESTLEVRVSGILAPVAYGVQYMLLVTCLSCLWKKLTFQSLARVLALTAYGCVLCSLNTAFMGSTAVVAQCALAGALLVSVRTK